MKKHDLTPPVPAMPGGVSLDSAAVTVAASGTRVYSLPATGDGVVRVSFVYRAGTSLQPIPFCASATANLLSEGTERYSALEMASELDFYGLYYQADIDRDYSVITMCCLSRYLDKGLELVEEILTRPAFSESEVENYRTKRRQQLAVERSKASFRAREFFTRSLFGQEHPYGAVSSEELYDNLTHSDVREFYKKHYTASNCFVVATGEVDDSVVEKVAAAAARLPKGGAVAAPAFPAPETVKSGFLEHPGAVQSSIRIGRILFPRNHPDFIGMQVVATVLGGYFGSRLVKNLREEHGFTYGAYAAMINLDREGYFSISTEVAAPVTGRAVEEILSEISRLASEPVPEQELDIVRKILAGEVLRILDGPFGIADVTIENIQNSQDNAYLDRFMAEVAQIAPERIMQLAAQYLAPDALTITVTGDTRPEGI